MSEQYRHRGTMPFYWAVRASWQNAVMLYWIIFSLHPVCDQFRHRGTMPFFFQSCSYMPLALLLSMDRGQQKMSSTQTDTMWLEKSLDARRLFQEIIQVQRINYVAFVWLRYVPLSHSVQSHCLRALLEVTALTSIHPEPLHSAPFLF